MIRVHKVLGSINRTYTHTHAHAHTEWAWHTTQRLPGLATTETVNLSSIPGTYKMTDSNPGSSSAHSGPLSPLRPGVGPGTPPSLRPAAGHRGGKPRRPCKGKARDRTEWDWVLQDRLRPPTASFRSRSSRRVRSAWGTRRPRHSVPYLSRGVGCSSSLSDLPPLRRCLRIARLPPGSREI